MKIWLLLILSSILRLGLKAVPPMQSKTSLSQTWHIPQRIEGLEPKPVHSLEICKVIILIKKGDLIECYKIYTGIHVYLYMHVTGSQGAHELAMYTQYSYH